MQRGSLPAKAPPKDCTVFSIFWQKWSRRDLRVGRHVSMITTKRMHTLLTRSTRVEPERHCSRNLINVAVQDCDTDVVDHVDHVGEPSTRPAINRQDMSY
jgi:hypothetical protein